MLENIIFLPILYNMGVCEHETVLQHVQLHVHTSGNRMKLGMISYCGNIQLIFDKLLFWMKSMVSNKNDTKKDF